MNVKEGEITGILNSFVFHTNCAVDFDVASIPVTICGDERGIEISILYISTRDRT